MKQAVNLSFLPSLRATASVVTLAVALGMTYFGKRHYVAHYESLDTYKCLPKQFVPMILSTDPLLIHIDEFVTPFEAEYLISRA